MNKQDVVKRFGLTKIQTKQIDKFVLEIFETNKQKNLVGKSTLENILVKPTKLKVSSEGRDNGSLKIALLFLKELFTNK